MSLVAAMALAAAWTVPCSGEQPGRETIDAPLLVTQIPSVAGDVSSDPKPAPRLLALRGERARVIALSADGTQRVLTKEFHSAADPAISFDGQRFLFAGKRSAEDLWNIYEMSLDTAQLRQVTKDAGNCRCPGYQSTLYTIVSPEPWYQLTFVSDMAGEMNENGSGAAHSLYSCRLDGSEVRRLTFNLSDDIDPFLMGDGRLLYASWRRSDLFHGGLGRVALFGVNIDGTDNALFSDPAGKRMKRNPCVTDRGLVVFIEADSFTADGSGQVGSVTFRRPLHTYRAITSEADGFVYQWPSPWTRGRVLISRRPAAGGTSHAVCVLDPRTGMAQSIFDDPEFDDVQAVAVRPLREPDGRSSVVNDAEPHAKMYGLNVYTSDFPATWLPAGAIKRLRILEGVPLKTSDADAYLPPLPSLTAVGDGSSRNGIPPLVQRRILGEFNVNKDGSFHVTVPANTPVQLQTLDEDGLALRTCGWIWSRNKEPRGCIGCHEDGELTPDNVFVDALSRPAVALTLPPDRRRTVDFRRDIMPIIDAKCVGCHDETGAPPRLDGGLQVVAPQGSVGYFNQAYQNLLLTRDSTDRSTFAGLYVHPGEARTSPLIWHLFGRNTSRPWDGDWPAMAAKPIPPGKETPLTIQNGGLS